MRPLILFLCVVALAAAAVAQPLIFVTPAATAVETVGETFTVDVEISDYHDLRGFSVTMWYNQATLQHTGVAQGNVFSQGGGPGGIFLASSSNAADGYILADGARIGGGGASGSQARLFRITFVTVAAGSTDIYFGEVQLRNSANDPLAFESSTGAAAVVSPIPDFLFTTMRQPGAGAEHFETLGATRLAARFAHAGAAQRGKLTAALYESAPPGDSGQPFEDPDGVMTNLHVTAAYWEVTSSLAGPYLVDLAFSYGGLEGPDDPHEYRVASRALGAGAGETWQILPLARTDVDGTDAVVRVAGVQGGGLPAQYALVFDAKVAAESTPSAARARFEAAFPNPVASRAVLHYRLPAGGSVRVEVLDVLGRRVAMLLDAPQPPGVHEVFWEAAGLAPGTYVVRLTAHDQVATRRLVVAR